MGVLGRWRLEEGCSVDRSEIGGVFAGISSLTVEIAEGATTVTKIKMKMSTVESMNTLCDFPQTYMFKPSGSPGPRYLLVHNPLSAAEKKKCFSFYNPCLAGPVGIVSAYSLNKISLGNIK